MGQKLQLDDMPLDRRNLPMKQPRYYTLRRFIASPAAARYRAQLRLSGALGGTGETAVNQLPGRDCPSAMVALEADVSIGTNPLCGLAREDVVSGDANVD
ncbi:hypothetical protein [Pseudomonas sp. dw_612]|uniref:hypothetical protein n=1 Tax=Pseudomonas sp. dw_612 TaxID=2720080 RepID=UPI001BD50945|nr:hypothetical protein [Pseudomonas sp. dw_612]